MHISLSGQLILQLHHGTLFLRPAKPRQQISAMGDGQMGRDQMHHYLASGSFARPRVGRVTISCVGSLPQVFLLAALDTGVDAPMRYRRCCGPEAQECVFRGRVRQSADVELLPVVVILMRDFFLLGTRCR